MAHKGDLCLNCGHRDIYRNMTRHHIVCNDGTTLSVQVGESLYCTPRDNEGPWTQVEVGFPSVNPPESWAEYADGSFPCDVYGYVPVSLVEAFIAKHGGRKIWT